MPSFRSSISKLALLLALGVLPSRAVAQTAPAAANFEDRIQQEMAVPGGLTADAVAARAAATSWSLEARRAELRASSADVARATWSYLPRVTLTGRYTRLSDVDGGAGSSFNLVTSPTPGPVTGVDDLVAAPVSFESLLDQYLLQASIVVPVSDYFLRVGPSRESTKLLERSAQHNLAAAALGTAADAKLLYYRWVQARLNAVVAGQALEQARAQRADIDQAVAAGTASRADLLGMDARVAESERALENFQHLSETLEEELRIASHDPEGTRYAIGENVATVPEATELGQGFRELVAYAHAHRPELAALSLRAEGVESSASVERAGALPRLDLFGNALYENPSSRVFPQRDEFVGSWNAGVQLEWVVSDIPGSLAAGRSAAAAAAALRAEHGALKDRIRSEVSQALQGVKDARASVRTRERELTAAEESYRVRRLLYQNGRATTVELMNAELALTQARFGSIATRLELRMARVRLDYALGRRSGGVKPG